MTGGPPRFVLASASPARRTLLAAAGIDAEVIVSGAEESTSSTSSVAQLTAELATRKAEAVAAGIEGGVVLGCDSLLEFDGAACGKPADAGQAREVWRQLAGRTGVLHTGHCLIDRRAGGSDHQVLTASTTVHFGEPSPAELTAYVRTGEPLAVAGAFTLDGRGGWWIEWIDGDHGTVLGLSLPTLRRMLACIGLSPVDFWRPTAAADTS